MSDPSSESVPSKILLIGDLASHTMLIREQTGSAREAFQVHRRGHEKPPLLPMMIRCALTDHWGDKEDPCIPNYADTRWQPLWNVYGERISLLDVFPEKASSKLDEKDKFKLRVKQEFLVAPTPASLNDPEARKCFDEIIKSTLSISQEMPSLLVLYDQNAFTREVILGSNYAEMERLGKLLASVELGIILGFNGNVLDTDWLTTLKKLLASKRRSDVIIQVSADCLRKADFNITKYGALEENIRDIFTCIDKTPMSEFLSMAEHVVIIFRETGSLYIHKAGEEAKASLHFCPNFDRIAQSDVTTYGDMPGKFSIFIAALAKELYRSAHTTDRNWDIPSALRLAAVTYNRLFAEGLRPTNEDPFSPFTAIEEALSSKQCSVMRTFAANPKKRDYLACSLDLNKKELPEWSRTSVFLKRQTEIMPRFDDLYKIVENGLDDALVNKDYKETEAGNRPWFPKSYITVPYAAFDKLKLVDSKEIAEHYSLAKILRKYILTRSWRTPLSIAVFGRPGSGKSFGVKQILKFVDPGRKGEPLTFNLAQFSSPDQLTDAFHQIQDRALSSDEVPLAIFDEFDAHFHAPRGWLKYFLAPMQDGLFRGKSGDYRVGRAIFLFSGGTADSYSEFLKPLERPVASSPTDPAHRELDDNRRKQEELELRSSKLSDFASRLRGHLDIADINEPPGVNAISPQMKLRRAVKLRSLLDQEAKPILVSYPDGIQRARIHRTVIDAFLEQEHYRHGIRSMEAIIQMSHWINGEFVPASLPAYEQLKAHVSQPFLREHRP